MASPIGLWFVFLNVLLEQLGAPVPALPTLFLAGALAAAGRLPGLLLLGLALLACLLGDLAWYGAGRLFGGRVMSLLCRISLTPDVCVRQTQGSFERWGAKILIVAKFIPGLALIAPPLAGATGMALPRFIAYSLLSAALWSGSALLAGALLHGQVEALLPRLIGLGGTLLAVLLLTLLLGYVGYRWSERRRMRRALQMARISVGELDGLLRSPDPPVVLDVRLASAQGPQGHRIPGALHVPLQAIAQQAAALPRDRDIVLYCSCPNEASAAQAAKLLRQRGLSRVRPLRGGLDAWVAAGYPVEALPATPPLPAPVTTVAATL